MRFSHDHAPKAPPRSFWLLFALFFLAIAVPVTTLNLAVDPFDFRLAPHAKLIREKIVRRTDTILWSAGELRRIPQTALNEVTIAVVGDSRTEMLTGGREFPRIFRLGQDRVISLSIGGASFDENIKLLEAELPKLPKLRGLVLAVPLERIGNVEGSRVGNALKMANAPILYGLNLSILASSIDLLNQQAAAATDGQPEAKRPDVDPAHLADVSTTWLDISTEIAKANAYQDAPLRQQEIREAKQWQKKLSRADKILIQERLKKVISPLVARLQKRGVKIIFFFPPLHPKVLAMSTPELGKLQKDYATSLEKFGAVEDFSRSSLDGLTPRFLDASHLVPEAAQAIFADIYLRHFGSHPSQKPQANGSP